MYLGNGSLHGCCIDRGNIGRAKVDVGEVYGTVDLEEVT